MCEQSAEMLGTVALQNKFCLLASPSQFILPSRRLSFFFFFLRKRIFTWQRGRYRIWQNLGGVGEALC